MCPRWSHDGGGGGGLPGRWRSAGAAGGGERWRASARASFLDYRSTLHFCHSGPPSYPDPCDARGSEDLSPGIRHAVARGCRAVWRAGRGVHIDDRCCASTRGNGACDPHPAPAIPALLVVPRTEPPPPRSARACAPNGGAPSREHYVQRPLPPPGPPLPHRR